MRSMILPVLMLLVLIAGCSESSDLSTMRMGASWQEVVAVYEGDVIYNELSPESVKFGFPQRTVVVSPVRLYDIEGFAALGFLGDSLISIEFSGGDVISYAIISVEGGGLPRSIAPSDSAEVLRRFHTYDVDSAYGLLRRKLIAMYGAPKCEDSSANGACDREAWTTENGHSLRAGIARKAKALDIALLY